MKPNLYTPPATLFPSRLAAFSGQDTERVDPKDMRRAETVEKAYGGIRTRHIAMLGISSLLDDNWSGIRLILRIERRRELKGSCQKPMTPLPGSNWPDPTGKIACFTSEMARVPKMHAGLEQRMPPSL
ncbi:hypothetical protein [Brucella anthropi]|uniref:Uncharacterized protein n=1 Tax=Brucella anthropi TaxID=529 RepID=A0A6L3YZV6_BRUAN|nr:hypothetical protein [Brucella anthropi]KAB2724303.1 hypothetical protein F9K90_23725 [Brucella anthropi]KAB2757551.1 hypothetical protein F9L04_24890 [Brucella anthropi]